MLLLPKVTKKRIFIKPFLATFLEKPGKVWSRDALLDRVWGRGIYVDTRTVDVHIGRLRRSLCKNGEEDLVRTMRGAGYALD